MVVSFLLPQALGNRVAVWGTGVESDQHSTPEDLAHVFPIIIANEGTGDYAHPYLL